jgi:cytochrome c oxidase subunit 1
MSTTVVKEEAHGPGHAEEHHELPFIRKYVFSTDHKIIGIQFLFMSLLFLVIGGLLAMVMRWQLAWPADTAHPLPGGSMLPETMVNQGVVLPEFYNASVHARHDHGVLRDHAAAGRCVGELPDSVDAGRG